MKRSALTGAFFCIAAGALLASGGAASAAPPHAVLPGETLSAIADRYNIPIATLVQINGLSSPDNIVAGQLIRLEPSAAVYAASAPGPASGRKHTVAPGESLSAIADHYNIPMQRLMDFNHISDADQIFAGQDLSLEGGAVPAAFVPASVNRLSYRIQEGETLSDIADVYGVSLGELIALNKLADPDHVFAGQTVFIPEARRLPSPLSRQQYESILRGAAAEFGIKPAVLLAIAWQESGWQQGVISNAGAIGLMQLLPVTAEWAVSTYVPSARNWRMSAADNARVGAAVLRDLLDTTDGDLRLSIASYYQGLTSIQKIGQYADTKEYVTNVMSLVQDFQ